MGLLDRFDVIEHPNRMLSYDDGNVDEITYRDPETHTVVRKPIKVMPEELRERDIAGLRRSLEGIDHRLQYVEERLAPWEDLPSPEEIERRRAALEGERDLILAKLAELEAGPEKKHRR